MKRLWRLWVIMRTMWRYRLYDFLSSPNITPYLPWLVRLMLMLAPKTEPATRALRLRLALESLGPIFVKFGQVMSTRLDLLPEDIATELALLQDRVAPFPFPLVRQVIELTFKKPLDQLYQDIDETPIASASVAQVHFAHLPDGRPCAIKVLRPGIKHIIDLDLANMQTIAKWVSGPLSHWFKDARRLKPTEVVGEFSKHLHDETDLLIEAGNASQLRRNTEKDGLLLVPEMYWDWCNSQVLTMEQMHGISIGNIAALKEAGIDLEKLSEHAVEIFFMQAFRDGFFHADMHPGNIFVAVDGKNKGKFIALDMGIVGSLAKSDKNYLAQNLVAFFNRDYHRVATLHIESGWVDATVRPEELASAVRACCEPFFDRPLKDISLGLVLLRLFNASQRFNVEVQPQLVLLQKTIFNVEGLGRQLNPNLDLWKTAKPILERWLNTQMGPAALLHHLQQESVFFAQMLPQMPRLTHQALNAIGQLEKGQLVQEKALLDILATQQKTHRLVQGAVYIIIGVFLGWWAAYLYWWFN